MTSIYKIPIKHVEIGMFVSEATPNLKHTGLNSCGLISRSETLRKLKLSKIAEIYIDTSKGKPSQHSVPVAKSQRRRSPVKSLGEERERAESVYSEARNLVGTLVSDVKMGKGIDTGPVEALAEDISDSVLTNSDALLCLSQIREKDQYLLEHSINVGVLMGVFTDFLGYERKQIHQLVTGAILHDIGKIRVPSHILNKTGKLTDKEWQEMRNHVLYGEEALMKSPGITDVAVAICSQHHEKLNGKGYPRGLKGDEISTYGRLASIVDIYDAITADRVYHKGKSPNETMRILASLGGEELDKDIVYQFIRCMSVYPVGTLVELNNGKLGVVQQTNPGKADSPQVKTFYSLKHRQYEAPKLIDLSKTNNELKVVRAVDADSLNIKVKNFI